MWWIDIQSADTQLLSGVEGAILPLTECKVSKSGNCLKVWFSNDRSPRLVPAIGELFEGIVLCLIPLQTSDLMWALNLTSQDVLKHLHWKSLGGEPLLLDHRPISIHHRKNLPKDQRTRNNTNSHLPCWDNTQPAILTCPHVHLMDLKTTTKKTMAVVG